MRVNMETQSKSWKQHINELEAISPIRFYLLFYLMWLGGMTFGRSVGVAIFNLNVSSETLFHDIFVSIGAVACVFLYKKALPKSDS